MNPIILEAMDKEGDRLQAIFAPSAGMNLMSFKKGQIELIDPSTTDLFNDRMSGLGPLIGPHFHRRKAELVPQLPDESRFPHVAQAKAKGIKDPFSHGVARYACWSPKFTTTTIHGELTGKDLLHDVPLSFIEGQNFKYVFDAELTAEGLFLELSIVSDTCSLVGIHYYYRLPNGKGLLTTHVQDKVVIDGQLQPIPDNWNYQRQRRLVFPLDQEVDCTFRPFPNPLKGEILLETEEYSLTTKYECESEENSWQLYHPKGASFVCIEPVSSQDPRHPNLSVSSLKIHLQMHRP